MTSVHGGGYEQESDRDFCRIVFGWWDIFGGWGRSLHSLGRAEARPYNDCYDGGGWGVEGQYSGVDCANQGGASA
jgi:hypothetical protein